MSIKLDKETRFKIYEGMKVLNIQEQEINKIINAICDFVLNNKKVIHYLGSFQQEELANKIYTYLKSYWQYGYNPNVLKAMHELGMADNEYAFERALDWLETMGIIIIKPDEKCGNLKRILKPETCKETKFPL